MQVIDNLQLGGAQRLLHTLATHLGPGRRLRIMSLDPSRAEFKRPLLEAGAEVIQLSGLRLWRPGSFRQVARALRETDAATVHIHLTYAVILVAPVARLTGRRVIVSLHNSDTVRIGNLRSRVLERLERFCLRHFTDEVIFVGDNVARANRARIGRTPGTTIRNVVAAAPALAPDDRAEVRKELGADPSTVVVISTGRLTDQKDPALLVRAFEMAARQRPDLALWLVGDGPLREAVEAMVAETGLSDRIRILGAREDVGRLLSAADIFALSSAWEGLPVGLLEAMGAGLPIVSTDVGDVGNVLGEGTAVLLSHGAAEAFAEALLRLGSDAELRRALGQRARHAAVDYTDVAGWGARLADVYARQV